MTGVCYTSGIDRILEYAESERSVENILERITFQPGVMGGKPVIRGLRISVEMILELLTKGASQQEILEDYPELEAEDLRAALMYAHHLVSGESVFERVAA